jgi:hypothetical protein
MPKIGTDGGYRLPAEINPPDSICVTVSVPNDLGHVLAFWGALSELGYWWNWERDAQKRGRDAAAVWRERIAQARINTIYGDCEEGSVQVRQRPGQPCKLDVKYGQEWEQFADLRLCPPAVGVTPSGAINIGGTLVNPSAPLGTGNAGIPIQPEPRVIDAPDRLCAASVNLAEILARTQKELCGHIGLSPLEQALAAVGVFSAILAFPPNVLWALPLVAGIATVNTFCSTFTTEDTEDLACILKQHAVEADGTVRFDRAAIQNTLTLSGRIPLQAIAFLLNYLDESALNYAASVPVGVMPCPCPQSEQTVWLLGRAEFHDQNEPGGDLPRSRFWESLSFNPQTGLNRIVWRFDNVAAIQGFPSIGCRIRSWNSLATFDNTTRTPFWVHYLRFTRANSAGTPLNVPAELRVWDTFGGSPQSIVATGAVELRNRWCVQINTNSGTAGFNNNNEYWVMEFSIRTGRNPLSLRATNSLGQTVNWNRY